MNLESLKNIDLRGTKITESSIEYIAKHSPELEELNLAGLMQLKELGSKSKYLTFPSLKQLTAAGCTKLKKLFIEAPLLKYLNITDCSSFTDEVLDGVISKSRQLQKLDCSGATLLKDPQLRAACPMLLPTSIQVIDLMNNDPRSISQLAILGRNLDLARYLLQNHLAKNDTGAAMMLKLTLEDQQLAAEDKQLDFVQFICSNSKPSTLLLGALIQWPRIHEHVGLLKNVLSSSPNNSVDGLDRLQLLIKWPRIHEHLDLLKDLLSSSNNPGLFKAASYWAIQQSHLELAKYILENTKDDKIWKDTFYEAIKNRQLDLIKYIIENAPPKSNLEMSDYSSTIATVPNTKSAVLSPDGYKIAFLPEKDDNDVRVFDLISNTVIATINSNKRKCHETIFSPDSSKIACIFDNGVTVFDITSDSIISTISADKAKFTAFSPDSAKMIIASWDYTTWKGTRQMHLWGESWEEEYEEVTKNIAKVSAQIFDLTTSSVIARFEYDCRKTDDKHIESVAFSPDGSKIAIMTPAITKILNLATNTAICTMKSNAFSTFSSDGNKIGYIRAKDGQSWRSDVPYTVEVFDLKTNVILFSHEALSAISSLHFSPDNSKIAVNVRAEHSDRSFLFFDLMTNAKFGSAANSSHEELIAFSSDSSKAAFRIYNDQIGVFDFLSKTTTNFSDGSHFAFSSDNSKIAIFTRLTAKVVDLATKSTIAYIERANWMIFMAVSPEGTEIGTQPSGTDSIQILLVLGPLDCAVNSIIDGADLSILEFLLSLDNYADLRNRCSSATLKALNKAAQNSKQSQPDRYKTLITAMKMITAKPGAPAMTSLFF